MPPRRNKASLPPFDTQRSFLLPKRWLRWKESMKLIQLGAAGVLGSERREKNVGNYRAKVSKNWMLRNERDRSLSKEKMYCRTERQCLLLELLADVAYILRW
jgi:hypothetical protein